ncbi:ABC transporter permease [Chryseolinea lacunae]|uniref:ABC transporter permease n=1 Tax=Chryseolinea lacunae TaxID=2801331 RepID=A0ABS1KLM8_9BACT|nr:ABC transporter permease [Chryseolinea lacunae]MBL0740364.1 ABC transporter permease [Chryseolinea lacunae]
MIRHNLLLVFRNFKRFRSTFFINLIGLSAGLACAILIFLWVSDELAFDKFRANDDRIFSVMTFKKMAEGIETSSSTPAILGAALEQEIPEMEYIASSVGFKDPYEFSIGTGSKHVSAVGQFVSVNYFKLFSYTFLQGDGNTVLADKSAVVVSDVLAKRLFGSIAGAVGKTIDWELMGMKKQFTVSGVFETLPLNASDKFEFALSFEIYKDVVGENGLSWGNFGSNTYALLKEGTHNEAVSEKIAGFIKKKDPESHVTLFLKRYSDRYLHGRYEGGVEAGGRIEYVRLFSIIAIFILVIACINFMNLSTAQAATRIKEVGVRKAIGAARKTLIIQHLSESMLMTFLALAVSILAVDLLLPLFNNMTGKQLSLSFNWTMVGGLTGIAVMTGLLAGSYPALYLSGFNPATVLKGKLNTSVGELWARRGLVVFQFSLSVIFIVAVLVVYKQIEFVQNKNLGYDKNNLIFFKPEGKVNESLSTFLAEVKKIPGVANASSTSHGIVRSENYTTGLQWEGKNPADIIPFENVSANYDLLETLGVTVVAGRSFSERFGDERSKIIFNEAAIDVMGLNDPVGKDIEMWGKKMQIIGVVKNFHFESLHENVKPLLFRYNPEENLRIMVKLENGNTQEALSRLSKFYATFNPGFSFDYKFLDQDYQVHYVAEKRVSILSRYFAGLAVLISCLGLFGLATFTAERRRKEMGIRKVLGSSEANIIYLLTSDFTKIVLLSIIIGLPLSYLLANYWLNEFAYRIELKWWYFIGAGALALGVAWLTVSAQAFKAARINPVNCLKEQ